MRKELMMISLAAAICGCGYDDGESDTLPALPETCSSDNSCMVGTVKMGACVAGQCQRLCETTDDCEEDTVCESGLCRPVVPCRATGIDGYASKKCIQVFSHTPSNAWEALRNGDVSFDTKFVTTNGEPNDFTSDNFKLVFPQKLLSTGTNFSSVTILVISYLGALIDSGNSMYNCIKPKIYQNNEYVELPEALLADSTYPEIIEKYRGNTVFDFSDVTYDENLAKNIFEKCEPTNVLDALMDKYIQYFEIPSPETSSAEAKLTSDRKLIGDKNKFEKIINALSNKSAIATTYPGTNAAKYVNEPLSNGYYLKNDLTVKDLLSVVAKEYKYYIQQGCSATARKLEFIASFSDLFTLISMSPENYGREWAEQIRNVIVQDYMYKDFGNAGTLRPIAVCDEEYYESVIGKNQASSNKLLYCTSNDKVTPVSSGDPNSMYEATYKMLETTPANTLNVACKQSLTIANNTKISSLFIGTGLLRTDCFRSNDLIKAAMGDLTTKDGTPINTVAEFLANIANIDLSKVVIPNNFWIVKDREQNLIVVKKDSEFKSNPFIISQKVTMNPSMMNLTGGDGFGVSQSIKKPAVNNVINKVNEDNYINLLHNGEDCNDSTCNFPFTIVQPQKDSKFLCGSASYNLEEISGYVVLKSSDKIGSRKVVK